jgi:hypothetical protein
VFWYQCLQCLLGAILSYMLSCNKAASHSNKKIAIREMIAEICAISSEGCVSKYRMNCSGDRGQMTGDCRLTAKIYLNHKLSIVHGPKNNKCTPETSPTHVAGLEHNNKSYKTLTHTTRCTTSKIPVINHLTVYTSLTQGNNKNDENAQLHSNNLFVSLLSLSNERRKGLSGC